MMSIPASEKSLAIFLLGLDKGISSTQLYSSSSYCSLRTLSILLLLNIMQRKRAIIPDYCSPGAPLPHFCILSSYQLLSKLLSCDRNLFLLTWNVSKANLTSFYLSSLHFHYELSFLVSLLKVENLKTLLNFWNSKDEFFWIFSNLQ